MISTFFRIFLSNIGFLLDVLIDSCSVQHHVFVCIQLYLLDCIEGSVPDRFASPPQTSILLYLFGVSSWCMYPL